MGRRSPAAPARAPSDLRAGVVLFDRYRLVRELGRGGVADVWRADDLRLHRAVAIKVLHPHLLPDAGWRRRFVAEARAASWLSHPGIVPVYDVLDDPETPAIVFQLVDGESLATQLAREGSLPTAEATRLAAEIAAALDHAHRAGLVHRDVKPANVVIDREGRARLVDFGIARLVEDASAEGEGHEVVGTLRYMAPEQLAGEPTDARTDLYALGLVIAEMVPDLQAAPPWLRELVDRLRAPEPADRPASAGDVARALETGRLALEPASAVSAEEGGSTGPTSDPDLDPDAVTRSFGPAETPRMVDAPPASTEDAAGVPDGATAAMAAAPAALALPTPAASEPGAASSSASPAGPARTGARTDRRPILVAALVATVLVAGVAIGRGGLPALGGGPKPTPAPALSIPTTAPVAPPKPHKPHGHGHGGDG